MIKTSSQTMRSFLSSLSVTTFAFPKLGCRRRTRTASRISALTVIRSSLPTPSTSSPGETWSRTSTHPRKGLTVYKTLNLRFRVRQVLYVTPNPKPPNPKPQKFGISTGSFSARRPKDPRPGILTIPLCGTWG